MYMPCKFSYGFRVLFSGLKSSLGTRLIKNPVKIMLCVVLRKVLIAIADQAIGSIFRRVLSPKKCGALPVKAPSTRIAVFDIKYLLSFSLN